MTQVLSTADNASMVGRRLSFVQSPTFRNMQIPKKEQLDVIPEMKSIPVQTIGHMLSKVNEYN